MLVTWVLCTDDEDGEKLRMSVIRYISFLKNAQSEDGAKQFFADGYCGYTAHLLTHVFQYITWWGNLWEHMCFRYERKAGELTKKLVHWNHLGSLSAYIFRHIDHGDAVAMWNAERDTAGDCDVAEGQSWTKGAYSAVLNNKCEFVLTQNPHFWVAYAYH